MLPTDKKKRFLTLGLPDSPSPLISSHSPLSIALKNGETNHPKSISSGKIIVSRQNRNTIPSSDHTLIG